MSAMSDAPTLPTKEERRASIRKADWAERQAMHKRIAAHKRPILEARRELGRQYLDAHPGAGPEVAYERAIAVADFAELTAAARTEAGVLHAGRVAQSNNGALEFPVLAHDFAADGPVLALGMTPEVLAPIVRYCGMLPVLLNAFTTRAHNTEILTNTAHLFHLDPEDVISFKIFVHLTEVDADCGPFHALPAHLTEEILARRGYAGIDRLTDEEMGALIDWKDVVQVTGPPGTVAYADTTRCFHFGGRPRAPGKPVRDMIVYHYLLPTSPIFPIDGDQKPMAFFSQLEARGEPLFDALFGYALV
jgi:hypothetical protein